MAIRENAVKPTYKPIKNDELKPIALIYKGMLTKAGVLALFTAEDPDVDATFVTDFDTAITAVGNIVPSRTIIKTNKDITKSIKDNSKKSVKYGKKLMIFLKKAFPTQPGLIESFPIVEANKKMRLGDTEGFLGHVNTIIQQIVANQAALMAKNWPASNLTDYQTLQSDVETLNIQQELAKKLVPENTDAATVIRNDCYVFIDRLVELKDLVYDGDKQKKHEWAVRTNLNQIRGGGASGYTLVKEADVLSPGTDSVDISDVNGTAASTVEGVIQGNLRFFASATENGFPEPSSVLYDLNNTTFSKSLEEFGELVGLSEARPFLRVQNIGMSTAHYKLTFKHLGPPTP